MPAASAQPARLRGAQAGGLPPKPRPRVRAQLEGGIA